ncbi:guanine nucleotide-binding protein g(o) subunit alpha [Anaeramoeba ignava]|uniref:Guanine nucleotide-binding protein g(O) subunit alpha n=1 Tax=Anaeramoeba ignava TaxID=1746090 RepID=A0A9Q0LBX5_ANAIG|nr:guanine nucleotide-binding protein g(o) subunit alpha [Anaeramoeba ignava]
MGNCCQNEFSEERKALIQRNNIIEKEMKKEKSKANSPQNKILLLGAGESGKSTLFKQMKLLQNGKFSDQDVEYFKPHIYYNCITQMKVLVLAAERLGIPIDNTEIAEKIKEIKVTDLKWNDLFTDWIKILWKDPGIQKTYEFKDTNFQLNESSSYFFENIERIGANDYIPTRDDILRVRSRTEQIEQALFKVHDLEFVLIDVGGQRTARRKWIHCFEDVTTVLFCASLVDYDQTLREDFTVNRMNESLALFHEICTSPWFFESSFVLFLNKKDLLKEKVKKRDPSVFFKDYSGKPNNYKDSYLFIKDKFQKSSDLQNNPTRPLYIFKTCAIDTKNIDKIFKSVSDTIMRISAQNVGII